MVGSLLRRGIEDLGPGDKVCAAECKLYGALNYKTAVHHMEQEQLMLIADQCKDKKVRHFYHIAQSLTFNIAHCAPQTLDSMGKIYGHAVPEMGSSLDCVEEVCRCALPSFIQRMSH